MKLTNSFLNDPEQGLLNTAQEITKETLSSIQLEKGMKGAYSWTIKLFYDELEKGEPEKVLTKIKELNDRMKELFPSEKVEG